MSCSLQRNRENRRADRVSAYIPEPVRFSAPVVSEQPDPERIPHVVPLR